MEIKRMVIVGAGGFAREVRWLAEEITRAGGSAKYEFVGYVVSDPGSVSEYDSKDEILGDFNWLKENSNAWDCLALGIGNAAPRCKVANELEAIYGPDYWPTLIHPTVRMDSSSVNVGHGAMLCANVVATVGIRIEPFAMVNLNCTIGHEAVLGRACTLNPSVNISGGVELGEAVLVGTGAQILQYLSVGAHAIVGAGALVTKPVARETTVVGMPAKPR